MRQRWTLPIVTALVLVHGIETSATAQLYRQNFQADSTALWTVRNGPSDFAANFVFDYSTIGIPAAPSAPGTRGMKLQANLTNGIFSGMSVTPTGQSFTGDYIVRFDWWSNFNGPFPAGGSGAVNLSTFGIGTAGTTAQWPGGAIDSVFFAATGDGNSALDWRAYSSNGIYADGNAVYAAAGAGNTNNTHAYYGIFGGVTAPGPQLALFPQQNGVTHVGSAGMRWHHVRIRKSSNIATWTVDGLRIATVNLNTVNLGGSNIFFGHSDVNASSSNDPNDSALLFTLIDNILVTRPADINGDGAVNVNDLLAVINNWGSCPAPPNLTGCAADIAPPPAGDGMVNVNDLLMVINNWG